MRPAVTTYEMSTELVEWLSHLPFLPFERSTFIHFRGIAHLVRLVDDVEKGRRPRIEAVMEIRQYNEDNGTAVEYDDVLDQKSTQIYSPEGEWAVYTDKPNLILLGEHDSPYDAFDCAPPDVEWVMVWVPAKRSLGPEVEEQPTDELLVFRSPFIGYRTTSKSDINLALGLHRGEREAYVIPPEIEAAVGTCPNILEKT
jgi:hypothetical protein